MALKKALYLTLLTQQQNRLLCLTQCSTTRFCSSLTEMQQLERENENLIIENERLKEKIRYVSSYKRIYDTAAYKRMLREEERFWESDMKIEDDCQLQSLSKRDLSRKLLYMCSKLNISK